MRAIATLGPTVRLVVFQFLMKSAQVPAVIPPKRASETPPLPPISGKEVLRSTPKVDVLPLATNFSCREGYELVDVWCKPHEVNWNMSFVRFVFCRKEHVEHNELHPDFIGKVAKFETVFSQLSNTNLWATQGHLNPYFNRDGSPTSDKVLMFGCAGRTPNTEVFSGGRDKLNRGMGQKVLLSAISPHLTIMDGNTVVLSEPESIEALFS